MAKGVDVKWEPYQKHGVCGFKATHTDGRVEYVYLNPSAMPELTEKERESATFVADVFLYHGTAGDPAEDGSIIYVNVFETEVNDA